jgi:hypothetical protein
VRVRDLPLTFERIAAAMEDQASLS